MYSLPLLYDLSGVNSLISLTPYRAMLQEKHSDSKRRTLAPSSWENQPSQTTKRSKCGAGAQKRSDLWSWHPAFEAIDTLWTGLGSVVRVPIPHDFAPDFNFPGRADG
jgi:hypothetical protein